MPSPPPATKTKKIFVGRFISAPAPTSLAIRTGAVLVTGPPGRQAIEDVDWEVDSAEEARRRFGQAEGEGEDDDVEVVEVRGERFFFPGFIGACSLNFFFFAVD